ncbi:hypothetical protein [Silvanigrella sp.]|jgi:hypothetical protein|uniref:hypothetical protein n=1 Tax=Silvanigrella sp. TaxID=2024976 RepID=UPI0037C9689E
MKTLATKNENEALEVLIENLDDSKTITDEFLSEFAGIEKYYFNRKANQLFKMNIIGNYNKVTIGKIIYVKQPIQKIIRKYSLTDVIIILSQYENRHQRRALKICRLALQKFINDSIQVNRKIFSKKSIITVALYMEDMFGGLIKIGSAVRKILDLSQEELMEAKLIHMQRIGKGLQKKQEELMILKNSKLNKVSRAIQELNACGL